MTHPYLDLILGEIDRAEQTLASSQTRALSVVTTSAGVITLLTGLVAFAASKQEDELGLDSWSIALVTIAVAGFVLAAAFALVANMSVRAVERPVLREAVTPDRWDDGETQSEHERVVAQVPTRYLESFRGTADTTARKLNLAIGCQIVGIAFAAMASICTLSRL